ncbi:MAG: hypothetical protein ISS33_07440 [Candidatus Omnitrophica bacterium]|nr:hypothetical protein [Candidatus Omnitrophota bacterium]
MNIFRVSCILGIICNFGLTIFLVAFRGKKKELSTLLFAGYTFSACIWHLGAFMFAGLSQASYYKALFWMQFAHTGAIFATVFFFHFIVRYLNLNRKHLMVFVYVASLIFLYFNWYDKSRYFLGDLRFVPKFQFYWLDALKYRNPLYFAFYVSFYWMLLVYGFFLLVRAVRRSTIQIRNKLKYFTLAVGVGWIGTNPLWLPAFHIDVYPYTNFLVALYPLLVAYVIMWHQIMDLEIVIKRTLVYSIIISIVTVLYFLLVYLIERIFSQTVGYRSIPLAVSVIAFFSIIFIPLKNYIQRVVDKYFFHGSIDEINAENIKLRGEIQKTEKLKAVATLAAGMAHEIKNPLTGIKTFAEYLPQKHNDPAFMQKFQKIVGMEVDKINNIVKQLLEFAKPSELKIRKTDVNSLLNETSDLLNSDFLKADITLTKNYMPFPKIQIDPVQMKQVFLNLLLNAKDSMPDGGTIEIKTQKAQSGRISIKISDTGKGIDKEDLKHIFDPFFTKKAVGTGLGLNVVHGIVTKHNGSINVESAVDKGTTIEIMLPHPSFTS